MNLLFHVGQTRWYWVFYVFTMSLNGQNRVGGELYFFSVITRNEWLVDGNLIPLPHGYKLSLKRTLYKILCPISTYNVAAMCLSCYVQRRTIFLILLLN